MTVVQRARVPGSDRLVWLVVGEDHLPVEPVRRYLAYLDDVERSPNTLRGTPTTSNCSGTTWTGQSSLGPTSGLVNSPASWPGCVATTRTSCHSEKRRS